MLMRGTAHATTRLSRRRLRKRPVQVLQGEDLAADQRPPSNGLIKFGRQLAVSKQIWNRLWRPRGGRWLSRRRRGVGISDGSRVYTEQRRYRQLSIHQNHSRLRNFFPINAPGMGRFKLFDLVGYS